ncbi:hypothetical protein PVAP13_8KG139103 [Panicum virgatum]|uniref:Uncharacterized protein n=1 Tax=Panicum virgatum TaxID=38727 RepID=A0A8T0PGN7_PANVG|nr:hypothetical protein PVAP13_8KG139103 [Panicum virgatum]
MERKKHTHPPPISFCSCLPSPPDPPIHWLPVSHPLVVTSTLPAHPHWYPGIPCLPAHRSLAVGDRPDVNLRTQELDQRSISGHRSSARGGFATAGARPIGA